MDHLRKMSPVLRVSTHMYGISKEIHGKTLIFQVNLGIWSLKSIVSEKQALFWGFQHIYGVSKEIHGKTLIFRVNLGMWLLKLIVSEKGALFWGFQHTFMGFLRRYMGKHSFLSKCRHVTPQIDHLRKISPVLRVSTQISAVSQEIDGKTFIFQVNLGMWPIKLFILEEQALFWGFQHTLMGFLRRYMGKHSFLE